ncbi:unnamed protein product [Brassica oleracea var. botrytis]
MQSSGKFCYALFSLFFLVMLCFLNGDVLYFNRRGYAATAAQASVGKGGAVVSGAMKKKGVEESTQKIAWIPDPKTGYYRPETGSKEIDPAELRAALLNNKQ